MFHVKHSLEITGFELKIVAIVAMTCNHVANVFEAWLPLPILFVLFAVGGITFPIMAFLLVEGYVHTSSLKRYALRLFVFALVSQIPYSLLFGACGNVLFTLLIGLGILRINDRCGVGFGLLATLCCTVVLSAHFDWATTGLVIIYMFSVLRDVKISGDELSVFDHAAQKRMLRTERRANLITIIGTMLVPMCVTLFNGLRTNDMLTIGYALIGYTAATIMLCFYRGSRGKPMKWLFYAYYPVHLLVIYAITVIFL
ncbi:TraX family protein [Adlercreutzia sp. ZJ304]|uniref:TraX family protein n=1 Tax=Adlercreutzia sp. ZJ304 TaxID=2709791 RepID=UPI0013EC839C|nr:TraX family protein [Adlercreutzia sp. ZJ304]